MYSASLYYDYMQYVWRADWLRHWMSTGRRHLSLYCIQQCRKQLTALTTYSWLTLPVQRTSASHTFNVNTYSLYCQSYVKFCAGFSLSKGGFLSRSAFSERWWATVLVIIILIACRNPYRLSIEIKIDDLEWPWTTTRAIWSNVRLLLALLTVLFIV